MDDQELMRGGLAKLFANRPSIVVVGEAADRMEAINKTRKLAPDFILMDISMPRMNGIEATMRITFEFPEIRIIALSMREPEDISKAILEAGAEKFYSRDSTSELLVAAVYG